jgi:hypothetical protein
MAESLDEKERRNIVVLVLYNVVYDVFASIHLVITQSTS